VCAVAEPPGPPAPKVTDWTRSTVELEWTPPSTDGGSKVTGYIAEFKEVNKEEEEKRAQRRLLLSGDEEEPEAEETWEKVSEVHRGAVFLYCDVWRNSNNDITPGWAAVGVQYETYT